MLLCVVRYEARVRGLKQQGLKYMVKKKSAVPTQKSRDNKQQMGLHFYHWKIRYEFDPSGHIDRFKVGPLKYLKNYIGSGEDDDTISLARQMDTLDNHPLADSLCRDFHRLIKISANQSLCYRGYILDETFGSVGVETIAGWLRRDVKTMTKIINVLLEVKLLEMVVLPDFRPVSGRRRKPPTNSGSDRQPTGSQPAADRKPIHDNGKRKVGSRKSQSLNPANRKNAGKGNAEAKRKISQKKRESAKTKHNAATGSRMPNAEANGISKAFGQAQGQAGRINGNLPTLPNMPTSSEAGGGNTQTGSASPLHLFIPDRDVLYDDEARAFAVEVYQLLKVPHPPDTAQCRRELGNFASAWVEAQKAGLSPPILQKLWQASMTSAASIGKKRRRIKFTKSAEAVWRNEYNKRLLAFKAGKTTTADG